MAISATIQPETQSILMSNESSGSLLSSDVPGYEIWTQIDRDMPGNMTVIKNYSDLTVTKMNLH